MTVWSRMRDIMYAVFLITCVAGFVSVMGLFGPSWLMGLQAFGSFLASALTGWLYYSFLVGRMRPLLRGHTNKDSSAPQQAVSKKPLFVMLALAPIVLWLLALAYALYGADAETNITVMLLGGWMGFMFSFWAEGANEYHMFPLPATFLLPTLGAWMYQLRWNRALDSDRRTEYLLEWSSLARIRQHPATASILLREGGPHSLTRMIWDGRHQDRRQALQRLREEFPAQALDVIEKLPPRAIASLGRGFVQQLLGDSNPLIREKATRASGFVGAGGRQ